MEFIYLSIYIYIYWGKQYPHPLGLLIWRMCGKVHRDLSDAIGPIAETYAPRAGCSVWKLSYLSIYLSRRDNWRLYRWQTENFGHGIALRSQVARYDGGCDLELAKWEGSAAAFHPSLHEAERERRARETIFPPHTRRFHWRGCPSSVYSFCCQSPIHCCVRSLQIVLRPPILPPLPTPRCPLFASWGRDCDGP